MKLYNSFMIVFITIFLGGLYNFPLMSNFLTRQEGWMILGCGNAIIIWVISWALHTKHQKISLYCHTIGTVFCILLCTLPESSIKILLQIPIYLSEIILYFCLVNAVPLKYFKEKVLYLMTTVYMIYELIIFIYCLLIYDFPSDYNPLRPLVSILHGDIYLYTPFFFYVIITLSRMFYLDYTISKVQEFNLDKNAIIYYINIRNDQVFYMLTFLVSLYISHRAIYVDGNLIFYARYSGQGECRKNARNHVKAMIKKGFVLKITEVDYVNSGVYNIVNEPYQVGDCFRLNRRIK